MDRLYIEPMAANAAALTGIIPQRTIKFLPMEGDMIKELSHLDKNEIFGKLIGYGFSLYAVALLAQVLQGYSLV